MGKVIKEKIGRAQARLNEAKSKNIRSAQAKYNQGTGKHLKKNASTSASNKLNEMTVGRKYRLISQKLVEQIKIPPESLPTIEKLKSFVLNRAQRTFWSAEFRMYQNNIREYKTFHFVQLNCEIRLGAFRCVVAMPMTAAPSEEASRVHPAGQKRKKASPDLQEAENTLYASQCVQAYASFFEHLKYAFFQSPDRDPLVREILQGCQQKRFDLIRLRYLLIEMIQKQLPLFHDHHPEFQVMLMDQSTWKKLQSSLEPPIYRQRNDDGTLERRVGLPRRVSKPKTLEGRLGVLISNDPEAFAQAIERYQQEFYPQGVGRRRQVQEVKRFLDSSPKATITQLKPYELRTHPLIRAALNELLTEMVETLEAGGDMRVLALKHESAMKEWIRVGQVSQKDPRLPLRGQKCVIAKKDIPCGTFLGYYNGALEVIPLSSQRTDGLFDFELLQQNESCLVIRGDVGENLKRHILPYCNSNHTFGCLADEYDQYALPSRGTRRFQPSVEEPQGRMPNVFMARIHLKGTHIPMVAAFALKDISKGDELEWPYGEEAYWEAQLQCQYAQYDRLPPVERVKAYTRTSYHYLYPDFFESIPEDVPTLFRSIGAEAGIFPPCSSELKDALIDQCAAILLDAHSPAERNRLLKERFLRMPMYVHAKNSTPISTRTRQRAGHVEPFDIQDVGNQVPVLAGKAFSAGTLLAILPLIWTVDYDRGILPVDLLASHPYASLTCSLRMALELLRHFPLNANALQREAERHHRGLKVSKEYKFEDGVSASHTHNARWVAVTIPGIAHSVFGLVSTAEVAEGTQVRSPSMAVSS